MRNQQRRRYRHFDVAGWQRRWRRLVLQHRTGVSGPTTAPAHFVRSTTYKTAANNKKHGLLLR